MKDNMKEKDLTVDFFFGNEEINPFDAPQMCVVRRLSNAYHELENEKLPANKAEINLRIAKLSFYEELIDISIQADFSQADIIALYEEEDLAEIACHSGLPPCKCCFLSKSIHEIDSKVYRPCACRRKIFGTKQNPHPPGRKTGGCRLHWKTSDKKPADSRRLQALSRQDAYFFGVIAS